VEGTEILKGLDLSIDSGKVHAIMGPNGGGKSTLAKALVGDEAYEITEGEVLFNGKDLLDMDPEDRAREGVFLGFQYPVEIPGVSNTYFLKAAVNAIRKHHGQDEIDAMEFLEMVRERARRVKLDEGLLQRPVNEGFSGGEKKRNEIFHMSVLEPQLGILDETDSGLDIDALRIVSEGVNAMRDEDRSFLVITHYQRLLQYIVPDVVHVLVNGRIVKTGGKELAEELETKGYEGFEEAAA
jgi:Fe-S cluster assembly ATP-binding protein